MASALAKSFAAIFSPRKHIKIAIIGLVEASGIDLLKRLSSTPVKEKRDDKIRVRVYTGTKSSLKCDFDFVAVEVGGCAPVACDLYTAAQFGDADGFIWVVNSADSEALAESRNEMENARKGRSLGQGLEQPGVDSEAPWLVLVDFKQNPLSMAEATRQAELVKIGLSELSLQRRLKVYGKL
ncbi:hypothetical protein VE02_05653 [Pseudogymnoascus sp. 03VT05]|nr:hypothetical protein VE02_05653 [Pseudogymnoascus sp. 03VT05]